MRKISRLLVLLVLPLLLVMMTIGCSSPRNTASEVITVGSKDFTESFILGEMYASMLENSGLKVQRKLNLGGTPVAHAALLSGQIDLYPEYTGTGLLTVLKLPVNHNPQQVFETVAKAYQEQFKLVWLTPSPMDNKTVLAMTQATAKKYGIKTISDMVANASKLTIIAPPEFQGREDGLPGLKKLYGDFNFKKLIPADPGLRYKAIASGQADVVLAFGTDGELTTLNLVLLEDDKAFYPPYHVAPVVRAAVLEVQPTLRDALNGLAPKITDEVMRRLNYEVSGKQREPADVAKEFLRETGLLKPS
ncbi:MAG: quaternary ammonium transporter [Cyanobacteria bacterium]|nr:quaternary ammonium transporter [Cyanobacteriota bacterium]